MSRFQNTETKVVVSVDDSKDDRFSSALWEPAEAEGKSSSRRAPAKKSADDK